VTYNPRRFNNVQRQNAKLFNFPNMEEALLRSGRTHELVLRGSFNRSVAVQREKLVFFAPSSDKWTDAIIANAIESDRGRCCAIQRQVSQLTETWEGIEILYSLSIDPRPLYAGGFDPTHLFQALGFLRSTLYRVIISLDGEIQSKSSLIWKTITKTPYGASRGDLHLGRREESHYGPAQIHLFKQRYPSEEWNALLNNVFAIAQQSVKEELSFMEEEAEFAKIEFTKKIAGLRAADRWFQRALGETNLKQTSTTDEYEQIAQALVKGISHPLCQMESVCFWRLEGRG
jgi:ATP-dependent helicase HepA